MIRGMARFAVAAVVFWGLAAIPLVADFLGQSYLISLATRIVIFALAAFMAYRSCSSSYPPRSS
jgi:hypothetical protein